MSTRPLVCRKAPLFAGGRKLQAICTVTDIMTGDAGRWYTGTPYWMYRGLTLQSVSELRGL